MKREKFFAWLLRHRRWCLAATFGVILAAAFAARDVRIDYGVEQFFLPSGPERERYEEYKRLFPREDARVTVFWQDRRGPGVELYRDMEKVAEWFEAVGLEDIRWLGSAVVAEQQVIDGELGIAVGPLVAPGAATDEAISDALQRHASDRLLNGFLWDTSQTVLLIHGYLSQDENTDPTRRRIETILSDSLATLNADGAVHVLTGLPIARARAPKLLEADLRLLLGAAFVVFFLILYWLFRHSVYVVLSLASVAPGYLGVLGLLGLLHKPISILTSFIPIVVLVVGMSDAVHLLSEFRRRRQSSSNRTETIIVTFASMAGPCFYTSLTTAVGFACLASTRIGIVVDFGLLTAAAILLTFVFSMTTFPALLSFAPDRRLSDRALRTRWLAALVDTAAERAARPSRRLVAVTVLAAVFAVGLASRLRVNTFLIDDTKEAAPFMRDIRWIDEHGFGFFQVNVVLRQDGRLPLHAPEPLAWMDELRRFAEVDPLVTHVAALPDFFAHLRRAALGPEVDFLPESIDEASQLLLMAQLQDPAFVEEVYHEALGVGQVIITVRDRGSTVIEPFLDRLDRYLRQHPFPAGSAHVTGTVTMIQSFTARLLQSFGPSIVIAIVLITIIMIHMFRSVRLGLIALVPNLFPLVVLLGLMSLFGFGLKPSTILVLSIAFGIAVDDTIHLLSRVARHASGQPGISTGLPQGIREAGAIMFVTTAIVTAGFALLMASHFQVLFLIGLMTAVSAVTAFMADLFVLPSVVGIAEAQLLAVQPAGSVSEQYHETT